MSNTSSQLVVLLSLYACEPGKGSEPGVGWNMARELSARVRLTVVTRPNNRASIESSEEPWIHSVRWIFWDPPKWLTFWKKGGRGVQLFYILWQIGIRHPVKRLIQNERFDIIHHITFGKYWIPSSLATLGVPFLFGPVGGGESAPPGLKGGNSLRGFIATHAKAFAQAFIAWFPPTRRLLQKAAWTFAATPQTAKALLLAGVTRQSVLPQSGISSQDFQAIRDSYEKTTQISGQLQLVTASRLIHWKAIDLAIEAVAALPPDLDVQLLILQDGPEKQRLKKLTERLNVSNRVEFKGKLRTLNEVHVIIAQSDALIHPALHEAFGQACIEALALGTPVICLDWAGPGMIVDEFSGFPIRPKTRQQTIQGISAAIHLLHKEKHRGINRRDACIARAINDFQWSNIADQITNRYLQIIK